MTQCDPIAAYDCLTAARRGAEILDEFEPDWYRRVRLTKLNMCSNHDCVLGQLYWHYTNGISHLRRCLGLGWFSYPDQYNWALHFGFRLPKFPPDYSFEARFEACGRITAAWKTVVHERRRRRAAARKGANATVSRSG